MPLYQNGVKLERYTELDLEFYKAGAQALTDADIKEVEAEGLLYLCQREYAVITPGDENVKIMGTDDATTCHMFAVRHTGSGVTALAHLDGVETRMAITAMIKKVLTLSADQESGRLEVHIVGGFLDDRDESKKITQEVLDILIAAEEPLHLITYAAVELNDELRDDVHFPKVYGITVDIKTGKLHKASFKEKGPCFSLRHTAFIAHVKPQDIYRNEDGHLLIGPYLWTMEDVVNMGPFLSMPDPFMRKFLSTSPAQEPPDFEANMKATIQIVVSHPIPEESLFPDNQPWVFKRNGPDQWVAVET